MVIYKYKDVEYTSWTECKKNFPNTSFLPEDELTDDMLLEFGIMRYQAQIIPEPEPEPPPVSLEFAQKMKITELKTERDNQEQLPIQTDKGLFDFGKLSRERILAAMLTMQEGETIEWTLADDTTITATAQDFRNVFSVAKTRSNALHMKYRDLRELVNACTTVEQVQQISWDIINEGGEQ